MAQRVDRQPPGAAQPDQRPGRGANVTAVTSRVSTVIAIDGPAASGKSSVSRRVAEALGFDHLDTGAGYRAVAWAALDAGIAPDDTESVSALVDRIDISFDDDHVRVGDCDVTAEIRTKAVSEAVSAVAANSAVRARLREVQRGWACSRHGVVAEGRDIGTVVFPDAVVKVYLTASPMVRAQRRHSERSEGELGEIADEIARRDHKDSTRADSPLRPADDAVLIDTSERTLDEVVHELTELAMKRLDGR